MKTVPKYFFTNVIKFLKCSFNELNIQWAMLSYQIKMGEDFIVPVCSNLFTLHEKETLWRLLETKALADTQ